MSDLYEILKAKTAVNHRRIETLPFFSALHAGRLPRTSIVSYLRCMSIIHAILERNLSLASGVPISKLSQHSPFKVSRLMADLEVLDAPNVPSVTAAIRSALEYGAEILTTGDNLLNLVGILYVLEGSQNGGSVLKHEYARCLNIPEGRLSYIGCYGIDTATHWAAFRRYLNALELNHSQVDGVVQAAIQCFERLEEIFFAAYPYDEADLRHHVVAVNCEAGDHAMPQNPLEIALALRAGRTAWERYPYLERRYGDRGKRFTSSDSCWLVTLTGMSENAATKNLEWLRTILASRGIATLILEAHLAAISQEFAAEMPGENHRCARFDRFLASRLAERRALLDPKDESQLIEYFDRRLRRCTGLTIDSTAALITSAWVDERSGLSGALAAVRDWFVDTDHFSDDWIRTVIELVTRLDETASPSC